MFKYVIAVLAVIVSAAAAPGYLGGYGLGLSAGPLLGHTGPALPLGAPLALSAPITKIAAAPAISYAAPIAKIAAPAYAPIGLGYKSYAAPAISYSAPITKIATAPALSLAHAW